MNPTFYVLELVLGRPLNPPEAVLYGKIVDATYAMFAADPTNLTPKPTAIPTGYVLSAWIAMSDFVFHSGALKFYGIVVKNPMDPTRFVVAIRGTEGATEWFDDGFVAMRAFSQVPSAGRVASGFDNIYSTLKVIPIGPDGKPVQEPAPANPGEGLIAEPAPAKKTFAEQIKDLAALEAPRSLEMGFLPNAQRFAVTGHSLGSALATLYVMENASKQQADKDSAVEIDTICTFASPRVGDGKFAAAFDSLPLTSWHIVNTQDLVPKLPPSIPLILDYTDVATLYAFSSAKTVKLSVACWHAMATYLNWLDPTIPVDSTCAIASPSNAPPQGGAEGFLIANPGFNATAPAKSVSIETTSTDGKPIIAPSPVTINLTINVGERA